MSGVTPESTTAQLAKDVPLEGKAVGSPTGMPGHFPETPMQESSEFSVNPIPATSGAGNPVTLAPGEKVPDPSALTANTVASTARDDPSLAQSGAGGQQAFGVNPLPATAGAGNPIRLKPGEKVPDPSTFTTNTTTSNVTTDRESYERGGSGLSGPGLAQTGGQKGGGAFEMPPPAKNMIPESSLPLGGDSSVGRDPGVTISSAAPTSTTAGLAANVPLEKRGAATTVPEVVRDSQAQAHVGPEAGASAEAVKEKSAVERELLSDVKPAETSGTDGVGPSGTANGVPGVVSESLNRANQTPEAAGNREAVTEKAAMESELLKDVKKEQSTGEPAPTMGAVGQPTATSVPGVVQESIGQAHQGPEAAANKEAVAEKRAMENELLKEVKPEQSSGQSAPTTNAAGTTSQGLTPATQQTKAGANDSRDVSPMTRDSSQPTVTTGVGSSTTAESSTPTSSKPSDAPSGKKDKRKSGFLSSPSASEGAEGSTGKEDKRKSGFFRKLSDRFKK